MFALIGTMHAEADADTAAGGGRRYRILVQFDGHVEFTLVHAGLLLLGFDPPAAVRQLHVLG